jgi:YidC/Oxa1 family membrane protein insertase
VRDGNKPPGESSFYSTFTGPAVYTESKKYQKVEFADIKKKKAGASRHSPPTGMWPMVQHYFASAWMLPDGMQRNISMDAVDIGVHGAGLLLPRHHDRAHGGHRSRRHQDGRCEVLHRPAGREGAGGAGPGLELVKDYGWLTILAKPLYWLLDKLHSLIQNWGWSIVGLVLLLKIAFYWLNAKAYASMAKMKAINPQGHGDARAPEGQPAADAAGDDAHLPRGKGQPDGGLFPHHDPDPGVHRLYWVLLSSVEMRNAPWVLWIHDLSSPDPYFILPIVMTLTTLLQTALNPTPPDPMQAKLMWFMPLIFSVMFFFFPAGLVLYWITNNILSIAQQWLINTRMGVPPQFNLPKF